jgi:hypothetical protein
MSCGGIHLGFRISIKNPNFLEDLQMIIPGKFGLNCPSGLREEANNPKVKLYQKCLLLRNYKSDSIQSTLDSPLQSFGFLF